jgi:hypothetical protein
MMSVNLDCDDEEFDVSLEEDLEAAMLLVHAALTAALYNDFDLIGWLTEQEDPSTLRTALCYLLGITSGLLTPEDWQVMCFPDKDNEHA